MDDADWRVPEWHPDHGDPAREVALLRSLWNALRPGFTGRLVDHEPGYLSLLLFRDGLEFAEVMIVRGRRQFGVFLRQGSDEERYFTTAQEAAAFLS